MGPNGPIQVVADMNCPYDRVYMLTKSTWCFWSLGPIGWIDEDGSGQFLRDYNADSMEARMGGYFQLVCTAPGHNGTGDISDWTG
jgi:hypothetical protein